MCPCIGQITSMLKVIHTCTLIQGNLLSLSGNSYFCKGTDFCNYTPAASSTILSGLVSILFCLILSQSYQLSVNSLSVIYQNNKYCSSPSQCDSAPTLLSKHRISFWFFPLICCGELDFDLEIILFCSRRPNLEFCNFPLSLTLKIQS